MPCVVRTYVQNATLKFNFTLADPLFEKPSAQFSRNLFLLLSSCHPSRRTSLIISNPYCYLYRFFSAFMQKYVVQSATVPLSRILGGFIDFEQLSAFQPDPIRQPMSSQINVHWQLRLDGISKHDFSALFESDLPKVCHVNFDRTSSQ